MEMSQYHYLPLAPSFFAILVGLFIAVLILQSVRYAYISLGIRPGTALFLLFASLVGSIFNIPIVQLPPEPVVSDRLIDFFGMQYTVPVVTHWRGTVIAVNVGGAVIPTFLSLYLLVARHLLGAHKAATSPGVTPDEFPRKGIFDAAGASPRRITDLEATSAHTAARTDVLAWLGGGTGGEFGQGIAVDTAGACVYVAGKPTPPTFQP